jgi:DNA-binding response OmpR family regulator
MKAAENVVDVVIAGLRKKLRDLARAIETVYGHGLSLSNSSILTATSWTALSTPP